MIVPAIDACQVLLALIVSARFCATVLREKLASIVTWMTLVRLILATPMQIVTHRLLLGPTNVPVLKVSKASIAPRI
jgi:hypothetical protein